MANLKLHHIYKVYPNGVKAVNDFNIDINDNEFIVFVGPSGCGKSTTLRMIAGLEEISSGDLFIDDKLVNDLEPKDRDIAFVFQNYALYPHMTVYDNMAYGLKNRKMPKDEIAKKVLAAAEMLDIKEYLDRLPKEMSGGQRQRVALGRALVRDPKVFLLDEPLSNLDAKLRTQMRSEITKLHNKIKTTFIYVTHDQVEAMTMGTRIVVMKDGYIQQIDSPMALYNKPINKFVAGFIGTPQMNFYNVKLLKEKDNIILAFDEENKLSISYLDVAKLDHSYFNQEVTIGIRPEHVILSSNGLPATVTLIEQLGTESIVYADIKLTDKIVSITLKVPFDYPIKLNDEIKVSFDTAHLHIFDKETTQSILIDIPTQYEITTTITNNTISLFNQTIKLPKCLNFDDGEYKLIIPSTSLTKGNDLSLLIDNKEENIIRVKHNDYYYHFKTNETKYSLQFEKLTIIKDDKIIHNPINDEIELLGYIRKEGKGKNTNYFFEIENDKLNPDYDKIQKVALTDGIDCHKHQYIFKTNINNLIISNEGIKASIIKELNYNDTIYLEVLINDKTYHIKKTTDITTNEIYLSLDFNKTSIVNPNTNIIVA